MRRARRGQAPDTRVRFLPENGTAKCPRRLALSAVQLPEYVRVYVDVDDAFVRLRRAPHDRLDDPRVLKGGGAREVGVLALLEELREPADVVAVPVRGHDHEHRLFRRGFDFLEIRKGGRLQLL